MFIFSCGKLESKNGERSYELLVNHRAAQWRIL